jgi:dTDP-4-dehydrorhamnose 3,5-epimerase-like enzyme
MVTPARPFEVFELARIAGDTGTLYVGDLVELGLPPIRRIALITEVPAGSARGGHAHKTQNEYLVCISGSVDVRLESRGAIALIPLRAVGKVLYLPAGYWRDLINFAPSSVLALLATEPFDQDDYLQDYAEFVAWEATLG